MSASSFNMDTYFEIAVRMEENGERFYRRAAEHFADPKLKALLSGLADAEVSHRESFQGFRGALSAEPVAAGEGPQPVGMRTLLAMAEARIFGADDEPGHLFSGEESALQVLRMAIEKEKDSVLFYQALQDAIRDRASRDRIVDILLEEIRHVTVLRAEMALLLRQA